MTNDVPPGWTWATLDELSEVILGQSPPGSSYNNRGEGSPFFQGKAEFGDRFPSIRKWTTEPKKHAPSGSILVSVRAPVGPTNVAPVDCAIGRGLAALWPLGGISTEYLLWAVRHSVGDLTKQATGSTFEAITGKQLRSHRVSVAPLAEQERIVATIEEHFTRLNAVDASLGVAETRCHALTRSIIVGALPKDLPEDWHLKTVAEAGETGLGRQRSPKYHRGTNMKPYLRVANVFEDRIDTSSVMEMHFAEADFEKYRLREGDILLNEGQSPELLGRPAMYRGEPPGVAFTNSLIRFVPGSGVIPEWALLVFRRHMHARRFMRESRITTNIAHLALGRFRTVEFPIPPLDTQHELVTSTRAALSSIDQITVQIQSARARVNGIRRAVLAAALSGGLVPQDPTDEAASVLLERIAASRRTTPTRQEVIA